MEIERLTNRSSWDRETAARFLRPFSSTVRAMNNILKSSIWSAILGIVISIPLTSYLWPISVEYQVKDSPSWPLPIMAGLATFLCVFIIMKIFRLSKLNAWKGFLISLLAYTLFSLFIVFYLLILGSNHSWSGIAIMLTGIIFFPPAWLVPITGAIGGAVIGEAISNGSNKSLKSGTPQSGAP